MSELNVVIDERGRLVTAVLAASHWPEKEQEQTTHAVHPHSKQLRQFVAPFRRQAAVAGVNAGLADGMDSTEFFTAALRCAWPAFVPMESIPDKVGKMWVEALGDFARETAVADFWAAHPEPWEEARAGLDRIFAKSQIMVFLGKLLGHPVPKDVTVMPTVTYPMLNPVLAETNDTLFFILPPAKAWGESPPWPHGEDPGWVIAQTCWHLGKYFLADTLAGLDETEQALLLHAAVTLCLEADFDEAEAMAYLVRSKKEHNLPHLPLVVEQLRDYLAGNGSLIKAVKIDAGSSGFRS
jgi:hypothetical protein